MRYVDWLANRLEPVLGLLHRRYAGGHKVKNGGPIVTPANFHGRLIFVIAALRLVAGHFMSDPLFLFANRHPIEWCIMIVLDMLLFMACCMWFVEADGDHQYLWHIRQERANRRAVQELKDLLSRHLRETFLKETGDTGGTRRERLARATVEIERALTKSQPDA